MPETVFQEGIEEFKEQLTKVKKIVNPKLKEANIEPLEHQEMNLAHEYWVTKFLYPFALDTKQGKSKCGVLDSDAFKFPYQSIDHKQAYVEDIMNPIITPHVEIVKDMHKYSREFPTQIIPHTSENGVVDLIHNYTRPKPKEDATGRISINALDSRTPNLTEDDIAIA